MSFLARHVLPDDVYLAQIAAGDRRNLLRRGVVLTGEKGQYAVLGTTQVSYDTAWEVLTDYDNFYRFLPSVASSRVVRTDGEYTVVEQIDRRRILLTMVDSTVVTENVAIDRKQISFRLLEGNLEFMYGHWRLDPLDWDPQRQGLLLVSQQVRAEADLGPFKGMFYNLFETSLVDTMKAICAEMQRREKG